jgi:hypothetical protein
MADDKITVMDTNEHYPDRSRRLILPVYRPKRPTKMVIRVRESQNPNVKGARYKAEFGLPVPEVDAIVPLKVQTLEMN